MLLKVGSKGDDVKKMQAKLGLTDDGIFGAGTEKAVKTFQAENGLTADGIVGSATWDKLFLTITTDTPAPVGDLDLNKLVGHIPDVVINQIPDCATEFQINTPLRLAHFLAQCAHESGGFKATQENLNYSAEGLKKTFSKYFPGNLADSYARQPEKIASRVYASRMGNGDEASKEGYKYRGRGYIQLTGKDNYSTFDKSVDDDILNNPDLVSEKYALLSAAWFWNSRSLNSSADKGSSDAVVTEITKKVNGGINGLDERIKNFKKYYALLA
ncbi:MAG: peptidoglycan-binding protein [Methylococcales bacterium]|nr:peptidoglycan-binding protein [Methylococcales bacterium]MDD5755536.1 peptidoglycan-binding protein [Methylococcales bacterium]